jgi:putative hydrolase of the HAD superfamily
LLALINSQRQDTLEASCEWRGLTLLKVVLFDVDGVLITGEPFSQQLARDYGITLEMTAAFFQGPFSGCLVGRADLKQEIASYLPQWGWQHSVEEFLTSWFTYETCIDEALLVSIQQLRQQGLSCYLATNQERYRMAYILNQMGFDSKFQGVFCSASLGYTKSEPAFFAAVLEALAGMQAQEILFWDDTPANVAAARAAGIRAELYTNFSAYERQMNQYLERA